MVDLPLLVKGVSCLFRFSKLFHSTFHNFKNLSFEFLTISDNLLNFLSSLVNEALVFYIAKIDTDIQCSTFDCSTFCVRWVGFVEPPAKE